MTSGARKSCFFFAVLSLFFNLPSIVCKRFLSVSIDHPSKIPSADGGIVARAPMDSESLARWEVASQRPSMVLDILRNIRGGIEQYDSPRTRQGI